MKANIPVFWEEKRKLEEKFKKILEIWEKSQNQNKDPAMEEFEERKRYENGF